MSKEVTTREFLLERYTKDYENEKKQRDRLDEKANTLFAFTTGTTGVLMGLGTTSSVILGGVSLVEAGAVFIPFLASIALFFISDLFLFNALKLRGGTAPRGPLDLEVVKENYNIKDIDLLRQFRIEPLILAITDLVRINHKKAKDYQTAQILASVALAFLAIALIASIGMSLVSGGG